MRVLRSLVIVFAALAAGSQQSSPPQASSLPQTVPDSCPMTPRPARPFIPPADYRTDNDERPANFFLIGSEKLWTEIGESMIWEWRPHRPGHEKDLTAKIFWFREDYNWHKEPIPKLRVTGKRIDGPSPPLMNPQGPATNAIIDSHHGAMLTGVYVPAPGCWEITGNYEGHKLSFNVWVVAEPGADQTIPGAAKSTEGR
jgi:hypothetical protein